MITDAIFTHVTSDLVATDSIGRTVVNVQFAFVNICQQNPKNTLAFLN